MAKLDFHIVKRIREQIANGGTRVALKHKVAGAWQGITWEQFGQQVDTLSLALLAQGLGVQDKIGIFSNNMPQWTIADFAALQLRGVTVLSTNQYCCSVGIHHRQRRRKSSVCWRTASV